jgi:hypothetical protein
MRRRSAWACLLAALFALSPLSCFRSSSHNNSVKRNPPTDPLLQSKCPTQAHYGPTADVHPQPDPAAPAVPTGAWAASPVAGQPRPEPNPPAPFRWASEKRELTADGKTRALEGKLEKAGDRWVLRCEGAPDGKVILDGHPRLDLFEEGDVIRVEGQLMQEGDSRHGTPWLPYRAFLVEHVRLVRRGR